MNDTSHAVAAPHTEAHHSAGAALRYLVIALTAFLTVVDLFATQAILPSLTKHYGVTPAQMGFAVNASTLGMAFSSGSGLFQPRDRSQEGYSDQPHPPRHPAPRCLRMRRTSPPSRCCAYRRDCAWRRPLRSRWPISASTIPPPIWPRLRRLYHRQRRQQSDRRLISAGIADHFGLAANFYFFAMLNLLGAALVYFTVDKTKPMHDMGSSMNSHFEGLDDASAEPRFARELRHRLLHPVRLMHRPSSLISCRRSRRSASAP